MWVLFELIPSDIFEFISCEGQTFSFSVIMPLSLAKSKALQLGLGFTWNS